MHKYVILQYSERIDSAEYGTCLRKLQVMGRDKVTPVQAWTGSSGFRRLRLPEFIDNGHVKAARLSALLTDRLHLQDIPLVFMSVRG